MKKDENEFLIREDDNLYNIESQEVSQTPKALLEGNSTLKSWIKELLNTSIFSFAIIGLSLVILGVMFVIFF
jgi:hypothetical protein